MNTNAYFIFPILTLSLLHYKWEIWIVGKKILPTTKAHQYSSVLLNWLATSYHIGNLNKIIKCNFGRHRLSYFAHFI